jgi:hypothetical protein
LAGKPEGRRPAGGGVEWIKVDRDWWRAVVNVVMNLRVLAPRSYLVRINVESQWANFTREEEMKRKLRGENKAGLMSQNCV